MTDLELKMEHQVSPSEFFTPQGYQVRPIFFSQPWGKGQRLKNQGEFQSALIPDGVQVVLKNHPEKTITGPRLIPECQEELAGTTWTVRDPSICNSCLNIKPIKWFRQPVSRFQMGSAFCNRYMQTYCAENPTESACEWVLHPDRDPCLLPAYKSESLYHPQLPDCTARYCQDLADDQQQAVYGCGLFEEPFIPTSHANERSTGAPWKLPFPILVSTILLCLCMVLFTWYIKQKTRS